MALEAMGINMTGEGMEVQGDHQPWRPRKQSDEY